MLPRGNTRSSELIGESLSLCERGRWAEAVKLIQDIEPSPETALVEGCVLALTKPEEAKDVLSGAIRRLPAGELQQRASLWLATAYWSTGEAREAGALLETIQPSSDSTRFLVGLNSSIFASTSLATAVEALRAIEPLLDHVSDLYKAKFYLQRGWLKRRQGEIDAAIVDYEGARVLFELSDAPRYLAAATNNLAGLLIDTKRFEDAHETADAAIKTLRADTLYLAQMYDQKASIFLAESKYADAEQFASQSVALLVDTTNRSLLADSLITHAKALNGLSRYAHALERLESAREIAAYLESKTLLLEIAKQEKDAALELARQVSIESVEIALGLSGGNLRAAARLVGINAPALLRFIRLHKIDCYRKATKSIITKPRNQLVSSHKKSTKKR